jgi:hypothetical protein
MENLGSAYLYTLATLAITFNGFTAIILIVFRQGIGGRVNHFDSFMTQAFLVLGFMVAFGALLPQLLTLCHVSDLLVWRISSIAMSASVILFITIYPILRKAVSGASMPRGARVFHALWLLNAVIFTLNAIGIYGEPNVGLFAVALTCVFLVVVIALVYDLGVVPKHIAGSFESK